MLPSLDRNQSSTNTIVCCTNPCVVMFRSVCFFVVVAQLYSPIPIPGIHGPKGKQGRPGTNGTPGTPGINAWKVKVNDTFSNELLVPPSIAGAGTVEALRPIIVHEGTHLRLRCAATGTPRPHVEWRRADGKTISNGAWEGMLSVCFYSPRFLLPSPLASVGSLYPPLSKLYFTEMAVLDRYKRALELKMRATVVGEVTERTFWLAGWQQQTIARLNSI